MYPNKRSDDSMCLDSLTALRQLEGRDPEHLQLHVREPFALLPSLENADEILIGPSTPIPMGNYSLGTNAILPAGGFAHTFSCTTVFDFLKRTGIGYMTAEGYAS